MFQLNEISEKCNLFFLDGVLGNASVIERF